MAIAAFACAAAAAFGSADRFQKAVDAGDVEALERMRVALQRGIAVGGDAASQMVPRRYDWAYLNWRMSHLLREVDRKRSRSLLKEAERQLDLVIEQEPESAEAFALRGSVIGDRIGGAFSGAMLGRKAGSNHKRALELGPENPRVALLRGIGFYFTPKSFGGGKANAEQELRRAVALFEGGMGNEDWPSWGHVDSLAWLGLMLAERGEAEEARSLYHRALALRPGNRWVRDELLADLEE